MIIHDLDSIWLRDMATICIKAAIEFPPHDRYFSTARGPQLLATGIRLLKLISDDDPAAFGATFFQTT